MLIETLQSNATTGVNVHIGADDAPPDAPLVIGAQASGVCLTNPGNFYSPCLDTELEEWPRDSASAVVDLAQAMYASTSGMWLGFVGIPGCRRLALVQSDYGKFYSERYATPDVTWARGWRDFYARAAFYTCDYAANFWGSPSIVVSHPTAHAWRSDVTPSFLDGVSRWAGQSDDETPRDVYFRANRSCEMKGATLRAALDAIRDEAPGWTPVPVETLSPSNAFGLPALDASATLLRVDVPGPAEAT